MPNMSFRLTRAQMRARTKTETRREVNTWKNLQPGAVVNACVKCQGLKKGERVQVICEIRILSNRLERLNQITQAGCVREGFPEMTPTEFVAMYLKHSGGEVGRMVRVVGFEYVEKAK